MKAPSPKTASRIALVLSICFGLHALFNTSFWESLGQAYRASGMSYDDARARSAFKGLPIDALAAALDRYLPLEQAVALNPRFAVDDFLRQRFTEGLYPRPVEDTASYIIEHGQTGTLLTSKNAEGRHFEIRLVPRTAGGPALTPRASEPELRASAFSILELAFCALGALGLGLGALAALRIELPGGLPAHLAAGVLTGALAIGCVTSVLTWIQLSLPRALLPSLGCVALAFVAWRSRNRRPSFAFARLAENWALAALLAALVFCLAVAPIALWDGRSIWFFQAKRLFEHGFLPVAALANGETLWSHPDYPLLFSGWLSYFGGFGRHLSERQAAVGLALLLASLGVLLWRLARARLGRWPGTAFSCLLLAATWRANLGGYADGPLLVLLVTGALAALSGFDGLSLLLLGAAALTKAEGLVFAACVALPVRFAARGAPGFRPRALAMALAAAAPALAHKAWIHFQGVDSILKGKSLGDAIGDFLPRIGDALALTPNLFLASGYAGVRSLLWDGALGAVGVLTLAGFCLATRARVPRRTLALTAGALAALVFALSAISALPESIDWFVDTALDRLLLLPAALLALAPLVATGTGKERHEERN